MRKKIVISTVILILGCVAVGSIISFSREKTEEYAGEDAEKYVGENALEFYYDYGIEVKEYAIEETKQENVVSKKNIEAIADSLIQAGDERGREDIVESLAEKQKRERANYLKAVKEGFFVTEEEIEKAIEETKEAIKGQLAEQEIEAYCKGAGITIEEYWEQQKEVYRKNYLINKYMAKCQEEFSATAETAGKISGDFSDEFERISDENIEEFKVVVE